MKMTSRGRRRLMVVPVFETVEELLFSERSHCERSYQTDSDDFRESNF